MQAKRGRGEKRSKGKMVVVVESKLTVREFDSINDLQAVEEMEFVCDLGPATSTARDRSTTKKKDMNNQHLEQSQSSFFIDNLGDPLARVRNFPQHLMLVAEFGEEEEKEIVGIIRCCIKNVTMGRKQRETPLLYTKAAYILGLRVSPTHRRVGIASKLVEKVEEWCKHRGVKYAYMATDRANVASLRLFWKLSYTPFRSPSVLVQPAHAHLLQLDRSVGILRIPPTIAASIYSHLFSSAEFFPDDISSVLSNPLTLGTFLAVPRSTSTGTVDASTTPTSLPSSFAIMSLWNTKQVYRMQVKGVSATTRAVLGWARAADKWMPWMRIPSVPDMFSQPLGYYFMYGLHMEGKRGGELMRGLCRFAHNMAVDDDWCAAVVTELGKADTVRAAVPHWRRFSWDEDVWCVKRLDGGDGDGDGDDWVTSKPGSDVIFVDPREV